MHRPVRRTCDLPVWRSVKTLEVRFSDLTANQRISLFTTSAVLRPWPSYGVRTKWVGTESVPTYYENFVVEPRQNQVGFVSTKFVGTTSRTPGVRLVHAGWTVGQKYENRTFAKRTFGVDLPDNSRTRTPDKESAPAQAPGRLPQIEGVEASCNAGSWRSILSACQNCLTPLGDQIGSDP